MTRLGDGWVVPRDPPWVNYVFWGSAVALLGTGFYLTWGLR